MPQKLNFILHTKFCYSYKSVFLSMYLYTNTSWVGVEQTIRSQVHYALSGARHPLSNSLSLVGLLPFTGFKSDRCPIFFTKNILEPRQDRILAIWGRSRCLLDLVDNGGMFNHGSFLELLNSVKLAVDPFVPAVEWNLLSLAHTIELAFRDLYFHTKNVIVKMR